MRKGDKVLIWARVIFRIASVAALVMMLSSTIVVASSLDEGADAHRSEDYSKAWAILEPLAETGDITAQYLIGDMYAYGKGLPKEDSRKAAEWFTLAADQGHGDAARIAAFYYRTGIGAPQDYERAMHYYYIAANSGWPLGQIELAQQLIAGKITRRNVDEALEWYHRAAAQGEITAMLQLGGLYSSPLYREVIVQSPITAYFWFNLASSAEKPEGFDQRAWDDYVKHAYRSRHETALNMTPAQIQEGQRRTREWIKMHRK